MLKLQSQDLRKELTEHRRQFTDLSQEELGEYFAYKQLSLLKDIRNYLLFFVVLVGGAMFIGMLVLIFSINS